MQQNYVKKSFKIVIKSVADLELNVYLHALYTFGLKLPYAVFLIHLSITLQWFWDILKHPVTARVPQPLTHSKHFLSLQYRVLSHRPVSSSPGQKKPTELMLDFLFKSMRHSDMTTLRSEPLIR